MPSLRYSILAALPLALAAADPQFCPARVTVRQQLASPVAGWTAAADKSPNALAGITFFDGKPEDEASLAPDKQSRQNGRDVAVWTFDATRPAFIVCRYAWTNVTLQRELPKGVRGCTVTYNPKETIAGLPSIEKIDCK